MVMLGTNIRVFNTFSLKTNLLLSLLSKFPNISFGVTSKSVMGCSYQIIFSL